MTDDDGEETEDDAPSPKVMSKPRAPTKRTNKAATGAKKNTAAASGRPSMLRTSSSFPEPPTPHSPQSIIRSGPSSRNASFSAADSFGGHMPLIMAPSLHHQHQPPTPQSPYYPDEDVTDSRAISPTTVIHREDEYNATPTGAPMQANPSFDGLRIVCSTPSTHQLLAQAQIQSSPGSLSSCSSATTNSCQSDYFYRQPTSAASHYPISPGAVPPYPTQMPYSHPAAPQHPAIMSYATNGGMLSPHHQVQHHPHQQQQVWYDYPSHHQHHLLQAQTHPQQQRLYYSGVPAQEMGYIKAEPEQNMLPTPRGSFC